MSLKDAIRTATVGAPAQFKSEEVLVDGQTVIVRQMSVGDRSARIEQCLVDDPHQPGKRTLDGKKYATLGIILSCFDESGARVFDDADADVLDSQPCGGWYDKIIEAVNRLSNVDGAAQKN